MFIPHTSDTGAVLPWEYKRIYPGTYQVGQLLNLDDGALAPIEESCTTTPGYLCMANITVAEDTDAYVPVTRIQKNSVIYEAQASDNGVTAGAKLRVAVGGMLLEPGEGGTFEVTYSSENIGDHTVFGRFI